MRVWPTATVAPSLTSTSVTTPAAGATSSWCIFIDSTSASTAPAATSSPGATKTPMIVPWSSDSMFTGPVYPQSTTSGERWNVVIDWSPITSSPATAANSAGTMKPGCPVASATNITAANGTR